MRIFVADNPIPPFQNPVITVFLHMFVLKNMITFLIEEAK